MAGAAGGAAAAARAGHRRAGAHAPSDGHAARYICRSRGVARIRGPVRSAPAGSSLSAAGPVRGRRSVDVASAAATSHRSHARRGGQSVHDLRLPDLHQAARRPGRDACLCRATERVPTVRSTSATVQGTPAVFPTTTPPSRSFQPAPKSHWCGARCSSTSTFDVTASPIVENVQVRVYRRVPGVDAPSTMMRAGLVTDEARASLAVFEFVVSRRAAVCRTIGWLACHGPR